MSWHERETADPGYSEYSERMKARQEQEAALAAAYAANLAAANAAAASSYNGQTTADIIAANALRREQIRQQIDSIACPTCKRNARMLENPNYKCSECKNSQTGSAQGGVASGPCEFPIWAALTQSQRECFMDGAGNIVANPTEGGNEIRNRAVETLLAAFFKGAVPTKDPCPNSAPADTPVNREAAWDVLCKLSDDNNKGALREEVLDINYTVFSNPVMLSNGYTFERKRIREWFDTGHNSNPSSNDQMTPEEQANLVPNTRLKRFIDTFNLTGRPDRKAMLGGRKVTRRRKSKSQRRKKSKSQRRRKSIKRRH